MKILIILALVCAVPALADIPPQPPTIKTTKSNNMRFEVVSDPEKGTRCIEVSSSKVLWKVPGWYPWSFLCDDGQHFITAASYDGPNLLSLNYKGSDAMFIFWKGGKLIRAVTVDELIPDKRILKRTVSHYSWGSIMGITKNGLLEVILEDGSKRYFDPTTGRRSEAPKKKQNKTWRFNPLNAPNWGGNER